jgi:hypothetical protein
MRDFYVGYRPKAAPGTARFIGPRVLGIVAIAVLLAALIALAQKPFAVATFEFGDTRAFEGIVSEFPYPTLLVARPGRSSDMPYSRYLLTAPGKRGMADVLGGRHGDAVSLRGTLIYRDDQAMIEVLPETLVVSPMAGALPGDEILGDIKVRGEIVDSKCYLGVMKPGEFKTHKACAIRCLSGGIPALFVVRGRDGSADHLLIAGPDGKALNDELLELVARPLEVTGQLRRRGTELILQTTPQSFVAL